MANIPPAKYGLGHTMRYTLLGYISRMFGSSKKKRISPLAREEESFQSEMREQLIKLKDKGLSIPIFTL